MKASSRTSLTGTRWPTPSKVAENHLSREYTVTKPNRVWCGDVAYVWCGTHWFYLALVIDLFARRIVGWACSTSPDIVLTKRALQVAVEMRGHPKGLLFHSDQGCHYTSHSFQKALKSHCIRQSMSRRGNCWDNVIIERTFRTLKTEWIPKQFYSSYEEAEDDILQFIKYYNNQRCHSYNNYLTPVAAEAVAV
ncbi:IS3 family transposase [bacterium AH-315-K03]|nr:IS3 family transposase [bacterium AH-315-K03]